MPRRRPAGDGADRTKCRLALAAVAVAGVHLLATGTARGQAGLLVPASSGRADPRVLSLREMAVDVGIARGYARVNVRQVFENHTGEIQEGTYRFRLPPSAAVGDFAVWDGLVRIPGVILEKQRARAIYRELTTQRIEPGLLQQGEEDEPVADARPAAARPSGGALFSVTVAPIPVWATKRLELQFQQEVPVIGGKGEFRLGLRPPDGEPPVAGSLTVRVHLEDGSLESTAGGLALAAQGSDHVFSGRNVPLDRDLIVRVTPRETAPIRVTAFRNPEGSLPEGLALAPWERPSEIPPEKDGFFLFEWTPSVTASAGAAAPQARLAAARPPVTLAILFDTSLSHRWAGLETGYGHLIRILRSLGPRDRFAVVPFDRRPAVTDVVLRGATPEAVEAALQSLRARTLAPGTDVPQAVAAARRLLGDGGRIVLVSDGPAAVSSKALTEARAGLPLYAALTGEEVPQAFRSASTDVLVPGATNIETDLFFQRIVQPPAAERPGARATDAERGPPFRVTGGEPRLRDIYPVMVQPPEPGSRSGWIGRYGVPVAGLRWEVTSPSMNGATLDAGLPERAFDARDLPRRWARARVDHLLALIESEGERREWVEEIIALSRRYKFVTPYTAFLAAPRSLLRPRRIQPGDPVLRVECDADTVSAVALFPFGLRLPLVRRPRTNLWEGRFLVPEGLRDGRYAVRILLATRGGARVTETKHFVLDGRAPVIRPEPLAAARAGDTVTLAVRTDEDVVHLSARLGAGAPVPLRWDPATKRSVGRLSVPASALGTHDVFFEAVDGAKNHAFARATLEVRP